MSIKEQLQKLLDNVDEDKLVDSSISMMGKLQAIDSVANNVIKILSICQKEKSFSDKLIEYTKGVGSIHTYVGVSQYEKTIIFKEIEIHFNESRKTFNTLCGPLYIDSSYILVEYDHKSLMCDNYEQVIDTIELFLKWIKEKRVN